MQNYDAALKLLLRRSATLTMSELIKATVVQMRLFYLGWPIPQTVSAELVEAGIRQTLSAKSVTGPRFPLP